MQKTYNVIIIDDEPLAIDILQHYIESFHNYVLISTFTDPVEALNFLKLNTVDLVFTDIAMPKLSGIELVKIVNNQTYFIITTAFSDYAVKSFELNVVDYLLKPISFERFSKAILYFEKQKQAAAPNNNSLGNSFFIKEGDEFVKVNIIDIDYIEGMKDYAKFVCGKNYYLGLKTLKSIEKQLKPFRFLRIHKSFIVPLYKIDRYNGKCVLINNNKIPVGVSYRNELKKYLEQKRF